MAGNGFRENGGGAGGAAWRSSSAAAGGGLRGRLSESQQGNNVVGGQGRVRAIGEGELAGRAVEIESDFILLDGGGGFDVENGIEAEGIGKIQIAPRDAIAVARKIQITGQDVNVSEQDGMLPGSADAKIGVGLELRAGPFHTGVWRGEPFDVKLQIAQIGRSGHGPSDSFLRRDEHACDLQALRESHALDDDAAGKDGIAGGAGEAERTSGQPAHPFGIADADAIGTNVDVIAERSLGVIDAARKVQRAATGFRTDVFKVKAGGVEDQVALHGAEPRGKIRDASGGVFNMHAPGDAGAIQRSFEGSVDLGRPLRIQIRHIAAEEPKVQSAIQTQG